MNTSDRIELMRKYLLLKFEEGDWHGVADAAMDLRELEVERRMQRRIDSMETSLFSRELDIDILNGRIDRLRNGVWDDEDWEWSKKFNKPEANKPQKEKKK